MFRRGERIWKQYPQNIAAVNSQEALYLLHYISYVQITRSYLNLIEIIDMQRYRIIRKRNKVSQVLSQPSRETPFLFPINKN